MQSLDCINHQISKSRALYSLECIHTATYISLLQLQLETVSIGQASLEKHTVLIVLHREGLQNLMQFKKSRFAVNKGTRCSRSLGCITEGARKIFVFAQSRLHKQLSISMMESQSQFNSSSLDLY
jgi:hypothetical protein